MNDDSDFPDCDLVAVVYRYDKQLPAEIADFNHLEEGAEVVWTGNCRLRNQQDLDKFTSVALLPLAFRWSDDHKDATCRYLRGEEGELNRVEISKDDAVIATFVLDFFKKPDPERN